MAVNISKKPLRQFQLNYIMQSSGTVSKKVCSNDHSYMAKIAAMPIYGNKIKKMHSFPELRCQLS